MVRLDLEDGRAPPDALTRAETLATRNPCAQRQAVAPWRRCGGLVRYHRLRLAHRTKAFLEAYLAQPIQIAELCAATGASMKSLERAFLEIHDVTPKRFLTVWRMSRARRALLAEAKDRISVALGCLRLVLLNAIVLVAEI